MGDQCIKIYNLEKVLEIKKDPLTQASFLEEVAKVRVMDMMGSIIYINDRP
jgi:hypothetical protein